MELSADEQRRWSELAAELRHDRRLAALAARFDATARWQHGRPSPGGARAFPVATWISVAAGGCVGLALLLAGIVAGGEGLRAAGAAVLVTTLVLAGALLVIGTAGRHGPGAPGAPSSPGAPGAPAL